MSKKEMSRHSCRLPRSLSRTCDNPIFSLTKLDPAIGNRLTREFKKPLNEAHASHIHGNGNQRTKAAVMAWFDTYAVFRSATRTSRHKVSARLLVMLIAISGAGGGARQDACA